jgi:hypothetical protein
VVFYCTRILLDGRFLAFGVLELGLMRYPTIERLNGAAGLAE